MAEITIRVPGFKCERCGHEWIARQPRSGTSKLAKKGSKPPKPRQCPACKSAWWDTPREQD